MKETQKAQTARATHRRRRRSRFGELSSATIPEFESTLVRWDRIGKATVLDLTECSYIDAAAIGVIVRGTRALGDRLRIVAPQSGYRPTRPHDHRSSPRARLGIRAQAALTVAAKPKHMKMLLQILVSVILHPVALVLMILNIVGREDLDGGKKLVWMLVGLLWGLGPILYITIGDGSLW